MISDKKKETGSVNNCCKVNDEMPKKNENWSGRGRSKMDD